MDKNINKTTENQQIISKKDELTDEVWSDISFLLDEETQKELSSWRLYFLRHGISKTEKEKELSWKSKSPQLPTTPLHEDWIKQVIESWKKLIESWLNLENTILIYSNDTIRVNQSLYVLIRLFKWDSEEDILKETILLEESWQFSISESDKRIIKYNSEWFGVLAHDFVSSSKKKVVNGEPEYETDQKRLLWDLKVIKNIITLMKNIREDRETLNIQWKNIIIVWHKSNKSWIIESVENKTRWIQIDYDMDPGEIIPYDMSIDWNFIDREERKDLLFMTTENQQSIKSVLRQEGWLLHIVDKNLQIWELQNYINAYFRSKPELYEKYLTSDNYDLRIFCIANLIKNGKFELVKGNLTKLVKIEDEKNMINFTETLLFLCENETQKREVLQIKK